MSNEAQYGGDPAWHPEPPGGLHRVVVLDEDPPEQLRERPILHVAPRTTRPQEDSPLAYYTNPGMTPGLDAGWILVQYAMPIDSRAFNGFRNSAFVCNLPPAVLERLRAIKRYAGLPR